MRRALGIGHPAIDYVTAQLRLRVARARSAETDRGASAVEWVIIAAVAVGIVAFVGAILMNALRGKAEEVGNCIDGVDLNSQESC